MSRSVRRILSFAAVAALTFTVEAAVFVPSGAMAINCSNDRRLAWADYHPASAAKGAKARWKLASMNAADWDAVQYQGFAAEVLWVGTDNDQADVSWVEVGATHGQRSDCRNEVRDGACGRADGLLQGVPDGGGHLPN
jgi:hypothetical protein